MLVSSGTEALVLTSLLAGEPGLPSPIYTDCRLLISYPDRWPVILDGLLQRIVGSAAFNAIAGVATSGIPHASLLAQRLDKPLVYAADDHVVGTVNVNDNAIVV